MRPDSFFQEGKRPMPKRPSAYHRPTSLEEALRLLAQPNAAPLGGGTCLLADDVSASLIVDLQDLGLERITEGEYALSLGAMARLDDILRFVSASEDLAEPLVAGAGLRGDMVDLWRYGLYAAGPNTFRHAITLGGLVAGRSPTSELIALLLVFGTRLQVLGWDGLAQNLWLEEYLTKAPQGLLTQFEVSFSHGRGAVQRVGRTPADAPIVAVVGWRPDGEDAVRLAAVGVDDLPRLLPPCPLESDFEAWLQGVEAPFPADFRGSSAYRRAVFVALARRVLAECA
jgi:CO/xanthine dehydrogenase FAD-binding subunit